MRIALVLSYNGNAYFGSQQQNHTLQTVLGELTHILLQLGITSKPVASGRTDRGVHATWQVIHIDLPTHWDNTTRLLQVLNDMLPNTMRVRRIFQVSQEFHARYSATSRTYRYIIKKTQSNPFEEGFISFFPDLDVDTIASNIKLFEGKRDFAFFMKSGSDVGSTVRTIYKTTLYKHKDLIVLYFQANGFLRSQIRLMVGALLQLNAKQIEEQLSCTKQHKIKPAVPNGLYLSKVTYPKELLLSATGSPI